MTGFEESDATSASLVAIRTTGTLPPRFGDLRGADHPPLLMSGVVLGAGGYGAGRCARESAATRD